MNNSKKIGIVFIFLVALTAGAIGFWLLSGDSPDAVSLDNAVASLDDTDSEADSDAETDSTAQNTARDEDSESDEGAALTSIDGTWVIDTETGEFDYESASGSFVGFRIEEELTIGQVTAVGRTDQIAGTLTVEEDSLVSGDFTVDVAGFTTNDSRRDNHVQEALDASQFPQAVFEITEPVPLERDVITSGESFSATAVGELTMHGVTNPVEFNIEGQLSGSTVVIVGSTNVTFSDFDVEVPSAPIIVSVDDFGVLEFQLLLELQS